MSFEVGLVVVVAVARTVGAVTVSFAIGYHLDKGIESSSRNLSAASRLPIHLSKNESVYHSRRDRSQLLIVPTLTVLPTRRLGEVGLVISTTVAHPTSLSITTTRWLA